MSTCCPLSCSCRKSLVVVIKWPSRLCQPVYLPTIAYYTERSKRKKTTSHCKQTLNTLKNGQINGAWDLIVLVDRKLVNHEWMFPLMPYCSSLCRSLSCGTVSNVLEKSKMAMSTCCPLSCSCRKSLIVSTRLSVYLPTIAYYIEPSKRKKTTSHCKQTLNTLKDGQINGAWDSTLRNVMSMIDLTRVTYVVFRHVSGTFLKFLLRKPSVALAFLHTLLMWMLHFRSFEIWSP
jgi:hypothetical protein